MKGQMSVLGVFLFHLYYVLGLSSLLWDSISVNPKLTLLTRLTSQGAPRLLPSLPSEFWVAGVRALWLTAQMFGINRFGKRENPCFSCLLRAGSPALTIVSIQCFFCGSPTTYSPSYIFFYLTNFTPDDTADLPTLCSSVFVKFLSTYTELITENFLSSFSPPWHE